MRFRDAVAAELERRRERDPRYSLRRLARALGVHHSTVSRLLRGARPVPTRTLQTMARRIGMSDMQIAGFTAGEDAAAVVQAIGRAGFRPSSRWLASVSSVSIDRVNVVLQMLLRTGALRMVATDRWDLVGRLAGEEWNE